MKRILFVASILCCSSGAFATGEMVDAPIDEGILVEGSRLYPGAAIAPVIMSDSIGLPVGVGGGGKNPSIGKGGGSKGPWTDVKNKKDKKTVNDTNKSKAKDKDAWVKDKLSKSADAFIKGLTSIANFLDKWAEKDINNATKMEGSVEIESPSGWNVRLKGCAGTASSTNPDGSVGEPCTEFRVTPVIIDDGLGGIEAQFIFSITKVDGCFTEEFNVRKCISFDNYTFVAGSKEELYSILNEVVGETKFY